MKPLFKVSMLAIALSIAPLSTSAAFCGSGKKSYKKGYKNPYPMSMHPARYNQAYQPYRLAPRPPMPPAPPVAPVYMQPQVMPGYVYQQAPYVMPMQAQGYGYGNMSAPAAQQPMKDASAEQPAQTKTSEAAATSTAQVSINGMQFQPATLKIKAGDAVEWNNMASMPHTVTSSNGGELASAQMGNGGKFKHTFTEPGTYPYYCSIHPSMKGQIIVE